MATITYSDKRVLIVDDQRPFLILLRGLLNNLGAQSVVTTQNGEAAIASCRKEKFDIIIADLHLGPDKKNGFQLLEEIRVRKLVKAETVFIIVSADSERPYVLGSIEKQPDDYLIKPFSQAQLHSRINKAHAKKIALKPIYQKILQDDYHGAIEVCRDLISAGNKYRQSCSYLLTDLFWKTQQYDIANQMLEPMLQHRPLPWVMLAMAKTLYLTGQYNQAISLANDVLRTRKLAIEGHDIIAQSYLKLEEPEAAKEAILRALQLSPLSINRQFTASEIARMSKDFELAKSCAQAIWEQSKKSVHRDVSHLCSYIRSILDAAEHAEDTSDKNKYQQEAMFALYRNRNDEILSRIDEPFDYEVFEEIVTARMHVIDGKLVEAKREIAGSQQKLREQFDDYPLSLAPDSIKVFYDLGEFEEAAELAQKLDSSDKKLDLNTLHVVNASKDTSDDRKKRYSQHNKKGIECYSQGKYQAAYEEFFKAQEVVPMNTGVALNMLQCLLKILDKMDKPDFPMVASCRKNYRLVDGIPLPDEHQQKFDSLKDDLKKYLR